MSDELLNATPSASPSLGDAPLPNRVPALRGRAVSHYLAGELRYACYLFQTQTGFPGLFAGYASNIA